MLLLNEVCGRQIGSWIADYLLLKIQKVISSYLFKYSHVLNVSSCYVNNHLKQTDGSKCNPKGLSYT